MMSMSWLLWMAFMFLFLVPPIGYGWGYRKWGPPYPRYVQRRRGARAATASDFAHIQHQPSGLGMGWRLRVDGALHWRALGCCDALVALK
jgi:hypothetical protein